MQAPMDLKCSVGQGALAVARVLGLRQATIRNETLAALNQWDVAKTVDADPTELRTPASQW